MQIGGMIYSDNANKAIEDLREVMAPLPVSTWSSLNTRDYAMVMEFMVTAYVDARPMIPLIQRILRENNIKYE